MFCQTVKEKMMKPHIQNGLQRLYVYGTLRPGGNHTVLLPGSMRDCGWFPGVKLFTDDRFIAEQIWVNEEELRRIDEYEGYDPRMPNESMYIRRMAFDGWIYEYNRPFIERDEPVVPAGDWLAYKEQKAGANAHRFGVLDPFNNVKAA